MNGNGNERLLHLTEIFDKKKKREKSNFYSFLMVFVGNHHPSSSHIINQKNTKTFEQHIKNTHVRKKSTV